MDFTKQLPEMIQQYKTEKEHDLDKSAMPYKKALMERIELMPEVMQSEEGQQLLPVVAKILKEDESTPFTDRRKSAQGF